jgi:hypothetical protein
MDKLKKLMTQQYSSVHQLGFVSSLNSLSSLGFDEQSSFATISIMP